ncbi:hypothetical protein AAMO2058_001299900 [Amorphochlora amoebiformis]
MASLHVGDIAHSLGIKKTKVGGGDKNVAYLVDGKTLTYGMWIIAAVLGCFAIGFFLRNFELQIKNKNYAGALEQADELEELALERVMEIGLTLEDFLRREALEEDQVDTLELSLVRSKRALLKFLDAKLSDADVQVAEKYLNHLLQPVVRFAEDRKAEAVEAKLVLGEVNQMLGQDDLVPEAPADNSAYMAKQHQWELENLNNEWQSRDYTKSKPPTMAVKKTTPLKKKGLSNGRDLGSRITKFFDGVKLATDVSFPEGFSAKFQSFKKSLGGGAGDADDFALQGGKRWNTLAAILKKYNIIDVDARTDGDEKLRERLLYEMFHEVDAILTVKKHKKVLDTLYAGYKAGNLAGGELMRILHSQKGLHEAFDWLFGNSENAEIMDSTSINQGTSGVAGGSRTRGKPARKATSLSNIASSSTKGEATVGGGFHHQLDSDLRAKSRATKSQSGYKTKFKDTRGSAQRAKPSDTGLKGRSDSSPYAKSQATTSKASQYEKASLKYDPHASKKAAPKRAYSSDKSAKYDKSYADKKSAKYDSYASEKASSYDKKASKYEPRNAASYGKESQSRETRSRSGSNTQLTLILSKF